jgi:molybdate transport system substrate-binding protein
MRVLSLLALLILGLAGSARAEVILFAASSTTDAVNEIDAAYKLETGRGVKASFAASATLARQIEDGAPANLFLSADPHWMDELAQRRLLAAGSRRDLLGNQLVLVGPFGTTSAGLVTGRFPLQVFLGDGRLAMGDPETVPAGTYGRTALQALGLWPSVKDRLALAESVRSALVFVERGEAPLGVVFATDAAASAKVAVAGIFPEDSHPPIVYPVALMAGADSAEARSFFAFLTGDKAALVFRRYGFTVR